MEVSNFFKCPKEASSWDVGQESPGGLRTANGDSVSRLEQENFIVTVIKLSGGRDRLIFAGES